MKKLLGTLKVIQDNVRMVHRNLVGPGWFADHKEFGKMYDAIDEMADDVIEIAISLGVEEPNLSESVSLYEPLPSGKKYDNATAFKLIEAMFMDLHGVFEEEKSAEGLPGEVFNQFEEYQYFLRKTAKYKIAHRLSEPK
jgi:DNA-binding ferritin-like protein